MHSLSAQAGCSGRVVLICAPFGISRWLMKAVVRWQGEVCFEAESETGHKVLMDGPPDHGGQNRGARPMEMILMGVGGCASFDVVHILKKARQDVTDCRC